MKSWLLPASLCAACLLSPAAPLRAQDPVDPPAAGDTVVPADIEVEPELTYDDYTVKGYTISVFGGLFYGDEYLNLPVRGERTFEDEGADNIMAYDGEWLAYNREIHDAPIKTIEDASCFGVEVGTWVSDRIHVDLTVAYVGTEAVLTMVNKTPDTPAEDDVFREEMSRDSDVSILRAGLSLNYELQQFKFFGIHPYVGFGFGGVIAQFTAIDDTGELFFSGTFGLNRPIADNLTVFLEYDLTTYAMDRDELQYTERVQMSDVRFGLNWFIDVVPAEVRALHEAQAKETTSRRR